MYDVLWYEFPNAYSAWDLLSCEFIIFIPFGNILAIISPDIFLFSPSHLSGT